MNLSVTVARDAIAETVDSTGFALVSEVLSARDVEALRAEFPTTTQSERNLLSRKSVRRVAASPFVRELAHTVLGPSCFAVRALLFNKSVDSNWKVAWHQDLKIAVSGKLNTPGFSSWSVNDGVTHVQPPDGILENMLAVRLQLDNSDTENGPLRCIPGSHKHGKLPNAEIAKLDRSDAVTCVAPAGSALLMHPLVVHASSNCTAARPRRVIHLEFANVELPRGLQWNDRI